VDDHTEDVKTVREVREMFPAVTFIYNDKQVGPGFSRNIGLEKAEGEWVVFADADDYFDDSFWAFLDSVALDASSDIIYLKSRSIDLDTGKESDRADYYNGLVDKFLRHEWRSEERILLSYDVPWGKIMRNAVIQENAIRFPQMTVGEDTVFSVTLATKVRHVKAYNQVMYVVTSHLGSLTTLDSQEMNRERFISSLMVNKVWPSVFTDSFLDKLIGISKTNRKECLWCLRMLVEYRVNPMLAIYRGIAYKWEMWRHSAKSC
jgi:glycosyltransferase involved in cell wall biosynthesis